MKPTILTALLVLLALPPATRAGQEAPGADLAPSELNRIASTAWESPRTAVLFDERADEIWAVGSTYKAGFERGGAQFVPFFGSEAPRNFPLRLSPANVRFGDARVAFDAQAAPRREGASVVYERGAFVERYDLGLESMEQTFLVHERSGAGPLVIELDLETELQPSQDGLDLVFHGERGAVRYSGAIAIDARGRRVDAPTRLRAGRIEIEVPAQTLEELRFPLLVDPLFSVFGWSSEIIVGGRSPDVTFDPQTGLYCVVVEHAFSASDNDVYSWRLNWFGAPQWESIIDVSPVSWTGPRIANHRGRSQVLVVAATGAAGSRRIQGRLQDAFLPSTGTVLTISPTGADHTTPDVGGDGSTDPFGLYCVTWVRVNSASDTDVLRRVVDADGAFPQLAGVVGSAIGTLETAPAISHRNGDGPLSTRSWTIAWHRWISIFDSDLYAARVGADGSALTPSFALDTTISNARSVSVSSPTPSGSVLVTYLRGSVGNSRLYGYLLNGATIVQNVNLSTLGGMPGDQSYLHGSVDSDGEDFVVAQVHDSGSVFKWVQLATFGVLGNRVHVAEPFSSIYGSSEPMMPNVTAAIRANPALHRCMAVWDVPLPSGGSILRGAAYTTGRFTSYCEPGSNGTSTCPCGNAPLEAGRGCGNSANAAGARLVPTDGFTFGTEVQLLASGMPPSSMCLLVQRNALAPSAAFGDGLICTGGLTLRMGIRAASNGQALWPMPGEPSLEQRSASLGDPIAAGSARYYFVYYRDPAPNFACSATFNTTQSLRVQY
ncbi:MAG: hypothetical protein JNK02_11450 [Planctomycetes bacterium]|nr:hypothetical protein [Planctomycetota bacterium]